jgi:formylglycine-generating enzyme required for sulfatase activity
LSKKVVCLTLGSASSASRNHEEGSMTSKPVALLVGLGLAACLAVVRAAGADAPPLLVAPFDAAQARAGQQAWAEHLGAKIEWTNTIGLKLILIPPGEFQMGSPTNELWREENETQHRVRVTRPFYLGMYEVTQAEYQQLVGKNPSSFSPDGESREKVKDIDTGRLPVDRVSGIDADKFCQKLGEQERRQYRLPTEAEWEYACRAGTQTPFSFGSSHDGTLANSDGQFPYRSAAPGPHLRRPSKVGSYQPNAFGLYDMHGNAWEWCLDGYGKDYYSQATLDDPPGPGKSTYRVLRSGSWNDSANGSRSAYRHYLEAAVRDFNLGLRVVCEP